MRRSVLVAAALALVLIGTGVAAFTLVTAQQDSSGKKSPELLRQLEEGHLVIPDATYDAPPPATPSNEVPATACGAWADPRVTGSVGAAIVAKYGEGRSCGRTGDTWIFTTLGMRDGGNVTTSGVIGLYECSSEDESCLNGQNDHPLSGWTFISPPHPGGVTILSFVEGHDLIVDNAGEQLMFDLRTRTFGPDRLSTEVPTPPGLRRETAPNPTEASN